MAGKGYDVHGESITDGAANGGIAVTLYENGSVVERDALVSPETLYVTDVQIGSETGGDTSLVADSKAAGRYLFHATLDAKDTVSIHFSKPFVCPRGKGLKFYGAGSNLNTCIIEGFIREA